MWFRFPQGAESINVEQQHFMPEVEEEGEHEGQKVTHRYFRAPDHFAGRILDLPGFVATTPASTDLPDLPSADPNRLDDMKQLSGNVEALRMENDALRAGLATLAAERDDWKLRAIEAETRLSNVRETGNEDGVTDASSAAGSKKK